MDLNFRASTTARCPSSSWGLSLRRARPIQSLRGATRRGSLAGFHRVRFTTEARRTRRKPWARQKTVGGAKAARRPLAGERRCPPIPWSRATRCCWSVVIAKRWASKRRCSAYRASTWGLQPRISPYYETRFRVSSPSGEEATEWHPPCRSCPATAKSEATRQYGRVHSRKFGGKGAGHHSASKSARGRRDCRTMEAKVPIRRSR
jgi:hypothetical protein